MEMTDGDPSMLDADSGADDAESCPQREVISQKERARLYRQQAYQKAKAWRAADPKFKALKEVVKQRRRDLYQQIKTQRKAAESAQKARRSTGLAGAEAAPARGARTEERPEGVRAPPARRVREPARGKQADRVRDALSANASEAKSKRKEELLRRVRLATTQAADLVANDVVSGDQEVLPPCPSERE